MRFTERLQSTQRICDKADNMYGGGLQQETASLFDRMYAARRIRMIDDGEINKHGLHTVP